MSVSRNPKFPVLDLSGFPVHLTARKDEMLDIGCCEGLLSDGRPFYARLWSENGTSSLSLFFSADGLSGADADMRQLLEREGLVSFGDAPLDACSAAIVRDSSGNEFWNVGISVGEGDPDELLQLLTAAGSVRLVTPYESGRNFVVHFPLYPLPERHSEGEPRDFGKPVDTLSLPKTLSRPTQ
jgi:hypothetical protein